MTDNVVTAAGLEYILGEAQRRCHSQCPESQRHTWHVGTLQLGT